MKNIVFTSIRRTLRLLPNNFQKKSVFLLSGIFTSSILDLIGLAAILPILASILQVGFIEQNTFLNAIFTDLGFSERKWFILFLCGIIVFFILIKNIFGLWIQKVQMDFSWKAYEIISKSMLKAVYEKNILFIAQNNSNTLQNKIVEIPVRFAQQLLISSFQFLNELIILSFIILSLLLYDMRVILILLIVILPFFSFFYTMVRRRISEYNRRVNQLTYIINKNALEVIFGHIEIKLGNIFSYFQNTFSKKVLESRLLRTRLSIMQQIPARLNETSMILGLVSILIFGVFFLENEIEIISILSVLGLAAFKTIPSVNRMMATLISIRGQQFVLDELEQFLTDNEPSKGSTPLSFKSDLKLNNVSFRYPNQENYILNSLNLTVKKGECLGISGKSGSGKTTLMNILLGLIQPNRGEFLVDGQPITHRNLNSWFSKIGYVRQDVFLLDASLLENIAFGIPKNEIDLIKLESVIRKSQLQSFVASLSKGINTNMGERGSKISGGQRQRIGIARALYHDAEILFFDEATSALDAETEKEITESIRILHQSDLTMVIIAHRESSLKYCDRIVRFH